MKLNTIARTAAAVILSLGALLAMSGAASADEPGAIFTPPYCARP
ncbi:hypothetical protein SAMN04488564_106424 [Lentzea waywayandensis]|uniref:Uncharacterized protein n=1 Tax=Lentzea waywayandensis TaxID=84724 RepID=A0A1I6EZ21_9PSEU|nr:hypothetical protein SAMN04488564_106424 [Lentzea waywayandensis]